MASTLENHSSREEKVDPANYSNNHGLEKVESDDPATSDNNRSPSDKELRTGTGRQNYTSDGKRILTEDEAWDSLGFTWPTWKKWMLLSSIFAVQVSMNFNTSVYPSAVKPLAKYWDISQQDARVGQMIFLIFYAFGCELWAPWSEEFGRWPILQVSLFLVNIWQIPAALAPNWASIVVARALVCKILARESYASSQICRVVSAQQADR